MSHRFTTCSDLAPAIIDWFVAPEAPIAPDDPPDDPSQPAPVQDAAHAPSGLASEPTTVGRRVAALENRPPPLLLIKAQREFSVARDVHRRMAAVVQQLPPRLSPALRHRIARNQVLERRLVGLLDSKPFTGRIHRQFSQVLCHYLDVSLALQRLLNECSPAALSDLLIECQRLKEDARALLRPDALSGTLQAYYGVFASLLADFDRCATLPDGRAVLGELRQCLHQAQVAAARDRAERARFGTAGLMPGPIFRPSAIHPPRSSGITQTTWAAARPAVIPSHLPPTVPPTARSALTSPSAPTVLNGGEAVSPAAVVGNVPFLPELMK